jgi:hypothetical protein
MPARNRPTPDDAAAARRVLLDGLARDADIFELLGEVAPLHPRNDTFPGEVFLGVAADALAWCGASRADPLSLEGLRERFLPECTFRGRQNAKLRYAVLAAAAVHGGTEPDLLDEVASWQTDDFWQYAMYAAVACIRAAASRAGVPMRQACQDLKERLATRRDSADLERLSRVRTQVAREQASRQDAGYMNGIVRTACATDDPVSFVTGGSAARRRLPRPRPTSSRDGPAPARPAAA